MSPGTKKHLSTKRDRQHLRYYRTWKGCATFSRFRFRAHIRPSREHPFNGSGGSRAGFIDATNLQWSNLPCYVTSNLDIGERLLHTFGHWVELCPSKLFENQAWIHLAVSMPERIALIEELIQLPRHRKCKGPTRMNELVTNIKPIPSCTNKPQVAQKNQLSLSTSNTASIKAPIHDLPLPHSYNTNYYFDRQVRPMS